MEKRTSFFPEKLFVGTLLDSIIAALKWPLDSTSWIQVSYPYSPADCAQCVLYTIHSTPMWKRVADYIEISLMDLHMLVCVRVCVFV